MTGIRPIYDEWLRQYDAKQEVLFDVNIERPELPNLGSRDVLRYAHTSSSYVLAYIEQAINVIQDYECGDKRRPLEVRMHLLGAVLSSLSTAKYYYDEMSEAIAELSDRSFMMDPETASYFMWVMQIWKLVTESYTKEEGIDIAEI